MKKHCFALASLGPPFVLRLNKNTLIITQLPRLV